VRLPVMPAVETRHPRAASDMVPPVGDSVCLELPADKPEGFAWLALRDGKLVYVPGTDPGP
jgi:hypothetical protein